MSMQLGYQLQQQQYAKYKSKIEQLYPALPIISKQIKQFPKPTLKAEFIKNTNTLNKMLFPSLKKLSQSNQIKPSHKVFQSQFQKYYQSSKRIYCKYNNKNYNSTADERYQASLFIDKFKIKANKQQLKSIQSLIPQIHVQQSSSVENSVNFDSSFESGNLYAVYQKSNFEYDLLLQNDINTKGNTQWFYFSVSNLPKDTEITLNIVNLMKSDSLFNYGMQPVIYSKLKNQKSGEGWVRGGKNIKYYKNQIKRQKFRYNYYTLSFTISSKIEGDQLHIAHCYPYTYTTLNIFLNSLSKFIKQNTLTRTPIGKSLGNNTIQVLTIAYPQQMKNDNRKIILVMARQHPGQSQGSYVCQGFINQLLQNSKFTQFIKKNYIIKIIPMVNPDGVIFGNYRTNLMGYDLNRRWNKFDKQNLFPEITCIKNYITQLNKNKRLIFILDLHGHSKKLGSFFYGNPHLKSPASVRAYPYLCSTLNKQISFQDCSFTIQQSKSKTARIYLHNLYEIIHVYTFESSFYGYINENKKVSFRIQQYKNLGKTLCQSLYYFLQYDKYHKKKPKNKYYQCIMQLKQNVNLVEIGNNEQSGSETNPQQYQIDPKQVNFNLRMLEEEVINSQMKKKLLKTSINKQHISLSISKCRSNNKQKKLKTQSNQSFNINARFKTNQNFQQQISKNSISQWKQQKKQKKKKNQCLIKKINQNLQNNIQIQTDTITEELWRQLQPLKLQSKKFNFLNDYSYLCLQDRKDKYQYLSYYEYQKKDLLTPLLIAKEFSLNKSIKNKDNFSQTILTYANTLKTLKNSPMKVIDSIKYKLKGPNTETKNDIKNNKDTIKLMLQKYCLYMRQRRLKPICFYEQKKNEQSTISLEKQKPKQNIPKSLKLYQKQLIQTEISQSGKSINYFFKQY